MLQKTYFIFILILTFCFSVGCLCPGSSRKRDSVVFVGGSSSFEESRRLAEEVSSRLSTTEDRIESIERSVVKATTGAGDITEKLQRIIKLFNDYSAEVDRLISGLRSALSKAETDGENNDNADSGADAENSNHRDPADTGAEKDTYSSEIGVRPGVIGSAIIFTPRQLLI